MEGGNSDRARHTVRGTSLTQQWLVLCGCGLPVKWECKAQT